MHDRVHELTCEIAELMIDYLMQTPARVDKNLPFTKLHEEMASHLAHTLGDISKAHMLAILAVLRSVAPNIGEQEIRDFARHYHDDLLNMYKASLENG